MMFKKDPKATIKKKYQPTEKAQEFLDKVEIYNEEIRDLLAKNPRNKLDLHEKPDSGVYVRDLSYFAVKGVEEINDVMKIGMKNIYIQDKMVGVLEQLFY